jgi:hypothetical protein
MFTSLHSFGGKSWIKIGKGSFYEILYRHWSDFAHAGGAFNNISKLNGVGISTKPVRCPEGIEQACNFAWQISFETVMNVVRAFASEEWPKFQQRYINELRPRLMEILTKKIINIHWENSTMPPTS